MPDIWEINHHAETANEAASEKDTSMPALRKKYADDICKPYMSRVQTAQ